MYSNEYKSKNFGHQVRERFLRNQNMHDLTFSVLKMYFLSLLEYHSSFSSASYYACKLSLHIKCDAVSFVSSVIKLSLLEQQVLLILHRKECFNTFDMF
jgi:hypothetical protein